MPPNAVLRVDRKPNKQGQESAPLWQMRFLEARCHILAGDIANLNSYALVCVVTSYDRHNYITITSFPFV